MDDALSPTAYRAAMARLSAAVNIVTTDGPAGRAGFTASAVCSVTDAPPTLLVCANRRSASHAAIRANGVLCVNTLAATQRELSDHFAMPVPVDQRFARADWMRLSTGAPALSDAVVAFDCEVADIVTQGTHDVFFARVRAVHLGAPDRPGLVYAGRRYCTLPLGDAAAA